MKSRALRIALATLFVGVLAAAAYTAWTEESKARAVVADTNTFQDRVRLVSRALLEVKSAQPGYVAAGQGDDYWAAKVDGLLGPARDALKSMRGQPHAPQIQSEIETASTAFEDFEQMDQRAREYARNGQRLLASDLVFSDGIEKVDAVIGALDRAGTLEAADRDAAVQQGRRRQITAVGAAAGVALLALVLLTPLPREEATVVPAPRAEEREPIIDYPIVRKAAPVPPAPPAPPPAVAQAPPAPVAAAPAPASTVDLPGIASLCTDLARVLDTRALPAALERAAKLLDAAGIVVWVADPDGRELAPVIAHGYPQTLVARMGTIERDAENVTAAAFRTGLIQTVKADAVSPGAIAAPLITAAGPVGVMAAEVLHAGERQEATRAAAAIVAAQLATLMGPPSARAQGKAEVAG